MNDEISFGVTIKWTRCLQKTAKGNDNCSIVVSTSPGSGHEF